MESEICRRTSLYVGNLNWEEKITVNKIENLVSMLDRNLSRETCPKEKSVWLRNQAVGGSFERKLSRSFTVVVVEEVA